MRFICEIYEYQVNAGRYFVHEHPWHADSWNLNCVNKVKYMPGVQTARCDQCMMGLRTNALGTLNGDASMHAMKPTCFMSNSSEVIRVLSVRCDNSHEHQALVQGRAKAAGKYPRELCDAICEGILSQIEKNNEEENDMMDTLMAEMRDDFDESDMNELYWDDVHGKALDTRLVREAREKEIGYLRKMKVYTKVSWEDVYGKPGIHR